MITVKGRIEDLLRSTGRKGIGKLIDWMNEGEFFTSPASIRYHGNHAGGLAEHSLNVYDLLIAISIDIQDFDTPGESLIIAALLHDICKAGAYLHNGQKYYWDKSHDKGHAILSNAIIARFIELTELEYQMIKYHMGIYGLVEFQDENKKQKGEYTLRNKGLANVWFHHPVVKVMYICDELAAMKKEKK